MDFLYNIEQTVESYLVSNNPIPTAVSGGGSSSGGSGPSMVTSHNSLDGRYNGPAQPSGGDSGTKDPTPTSNLIVSGPTLPVDGSSKNMMLYFAIGALALVAMSRR
jgi:hypothetical protein